MSVQQMRDPFVSNSIVESEVDQQIWINYDRRAKRRASAEEREIDHFTPGALPRKRYDRWSELAKRLVDICGASVAILAFSPLFILAAIAVKLTSKGPIFFSQIRVREGGKLFRMYKFRTMVTNAEQLKDALAQQNESSGPVFKMTNDPRITAVGRILRKFSIDELPQLFNVLKGDMSLVGPRPPLPKEVKKYKRWQLRRLAVKPGITCIWQVSGRNQIEFEDWIRLDIKYIENRSLFLDLQLLVKTFKVVFLAPDGK